MPADLPTSRGFPEQFAAGMRAPLGSEEPSVIARLGSLPEGSTFRFRSYHGGTWRVGKPDRSGSEHPRCHSIEFETSKPFRADIEVVVISRPPADHALETGKEYTLGQLPDGTLFRFLDGTPGTWLRYTSDKGFLCAYMTESPSYNQAFDPGIAVVVVRTDPFDAADYYDCGREPDRLTHTTPLAAILAVGGEEHDPITASEILNRCPITVAAYQIQPIKDEWFTFCARHLANEARDLFADDELLGGPDGKLIPQEQVDAFAAALEPAVRAMMAGIKPWHCEQVATREYSAEQVEALLREAKPEWFTE